VSDAGGPVRRRRIAGESGPAAPAKKAADQRPTAKKPPTVKKAASKKAAVDQPTVKKAASKKVTSKKATAEPAAAAPAPLSNKAAPSQPASKPVVRTSPVTRPIPPVATPTTKASEPEADRPAGSRPSRRDLLWLVPATLLAAAALVVGVFLVVNPPGSADSGAELESSRRQASSAAAGAAETIFTFRYDQLDEHLEASKALMTPAFAKEFDKIAPALTELAPQRNIVVQAVSRESAALPCGDECSSTKADVLVFVDQARLIGDSTEPTVFANRIKVSMVKGDDGWLVSNIRAL
jgi:Mce-associated membrane protein